MAQTDPKDSSLVKQDDGIALLDTTIDYDAFFDEFEAFMDSILNPRSYLMINVSMNRAYFNYRRNSRVESSPKIVYTPMITYYNRSGFGITATGYVVNDEKNINLYQYSISPSYDYLKNIRLATGFAYTRYGGKDSLPFYTSPLRNEVYAYFTYRKSWIRPMIAVNYGWGSRTDVDKRRTLIRALRLRRRGFSFINTTESIQDFSLTTSIRHDFYWLDLLKKNDHIRFTPQLNFTSGTQKFGFNQSTNTYATTIRNSTNILYNTRNVTLDDQLDFQPLALTLFLRGEYAIGKFFVQPQFTLDYYFPGDEKKLNALFSLNAGFVF